MARELRKRGSGEAERTWERFDLAQEKFLMFLDRGAWRRRGSPARLDPKLAGRDTCRLTKKR